MRAYEVLCEGFVYVGNCTDKHTSPHLQDMMDGARRIGYRTFTKAVGLDSVQSIFRDYGWGHQRGDLRMKNDPYVYYYRSKYDGKLCYYVRHSGIEYIFLEDTDQDQDVDKVGAVIPISPNKFSIMGDGAVLNTIKSGATFHGMKTPNSLSITATSAPSVHAATALTRMIKQSKLEIITMDDEEEPAKETLTWLRQFL
jgi:hypothetical protein